MSQNTPLDDFEIVLVGCGKMGSALAGGLVESDTVAAERVVCVDHHEETARELAERLDARRADIDTVLDSPPTAADRRLYVVAVKPKDVREVLEEAADGLRDDDLVVSVAAGVPLELIREWAGPTPTLARVMPNTPALVGRSVTGVLVEDADGDEGDDDHEDERRAVRLLFEGVGRVVELQDESDFDALTAVSGSGPAYVFTAIEALADGAVAQGLSREAAITLAIETLAGSAELAARSDLHTAELKDQVASPGGTTIRGLRELERHGFRRALIEAVDAAAARSRDMTSGLLEDS